MHTTIYYTTLPPFFVYFSCRFCSSSTVTTQKTGKPVYTKTLLSRMYSSVCYTTYLPIRSLFVILSCLTPWKWYYEFKRRRKMKKDTNKSICIRFPCFVRIIICKANTKYYCTTTLYTTQSNHSLHIHWYVHSCRQPAAHSKNSIPSPIPELLHSSQHHQRFSLFLLGCFFLHHYFFFSCSAHTVGIFFPPQNKLLNFYVLGAMPRKK